MPTKATPPSLDTLNGNNTGYTGYGLQPSSAGTEDTQSGTEGRVRKRLQKSPSTGSKVRRRTENQVADTNEAPANSRRKPSLRNYQPPRGARPLLRSPSKRVPSDATSTSVTSTSAPRQFPLTQQPSVGTGQPFGIAVQGAQSTDKNTIDKSTTIEFLPEVNFDDLHSSITGEPNYYDAAASSASTESASTERNALTYSRNASFAATSNHSANSSSLKPPSEAPTGSKLAQSRLNRSNSTQRQQVNASRQRAPPVNKLDSAGPDVTQFAPRPRRQSHFPASTTSTAATRWPRKSVGPGILATGSSDYSLLSDGIPNKTDREQSSNFRQPRGIAPTQPASRNSLAPNEGLDVFSATNGAKRKSMQPSKTRHEFLNSPSTPDSPWASSSIAAARSPARDATAGATTPSSGKRLSVMPGHATGLGARTISPTDARRLKRLSMMPNPPSLPMTPPICFPEPPRSKSRPNAESPSIAPRKSTTPTSTRTTPDPNRKSINSTVSVASNTSFSSLRASTATARAQHSLSTSSRLPTLKIKSENPPNPPEEVVPPVPAIPKAYESPKNEQDIPFFSSRKASLTHDAGSIGSASTSEYVSGVSTTSSDKETPKTDSEGKPRRVATLNQDGRDDERASGAQNGRRTLQPIRLPPLNLLPINTPTAEKMAAFKEQGKDVDSGLATPPPSRRPPKTPSTPMTASKAAFFSKMSTMDDHNSNPTQARSSSSHHTLRSDATHFRAPSSSSSIRGLTDLRTGRKPVSPFVSSSLPKASGDFNALRSKASGDRTASTVDVDAKIPRLTGPRAQTSAKTSKIDVLNQSGVLTDSETVSFGTTLRRKLSLTRKRSSSKADTERPPQVPDHETMPPPKLPASATWSGAWNPVTSSSAQKPTYLHSRRQSSHAEVFARHDRSRSDAVSAHGATDKDSAPSENTASHALRRAPSNIPSSSRPHQVNGSSGASKFLGVDTQLDRQDLQAEEEMKKLASKRKNTEAAAKELDELRRRATPKERVSPSQALWAARLNIFERGEVIDFKDVYFCGTQRAHKHSGDLASESANFGYDDDRGDYKIVLGDHLAYRYEVVDVLGKGSFGQVVRCIDHKTGGLVAIKIIRNKKRFHQQALVEVNILKKLREWDAGNKFSMVNFTQSFYFRGHLCISTELLGMNLYEFIKIHDFKGFSLKLIRRFTKQLLNSLILLKSHKVIHCDMKPENILLAHPAHSEIKVIDFGSSCLENEKVYTYIQSRFYRSPEVILGMSYGMPIDMWSLGCILAELLTGYPIFPGENEQEQLACIMEVFGPPDKHLIEKSSRRKLFFDSLGKPRLSVSSKGKRRRPSSKTLQQVLKCDDDAFLDFLARCLRWDPDRRMKPDEAIRHEFITGVKQAAPRNVRTLPQSSTSTSPIRRFNSVHTPSSATRPLHDPPVTSLRNGAAARTRDGLNGSPIKGNARRLSTMPGTTSGIGAAGKKGVNGLGINPTATLPKLAARTASGKGVDLASAAAAAATNVSQR